MQGPAHATCIVKLGGAAITEKAQREILRADVLQRVAHDLQAAHERGVRIVIVHGAGGFGHHDAAQHGLARGGLPGAPPVAVARGFALTRASVTRLNHLVVAALLRAGLPACGMSPCGVWETAGGRAVARDACGVDAVRAVLRAGLVPVLHGDAVVDAVQGVAILSGDTIVRRLAEALRPAWVVFLTDVAGIYDRPPSQPGARLVREVVVSSADKGWTFSVVGPGGSGAAAAGDTAAEDGAAAAAGGSDGRPCFAAVAEIVPRPRMDAAAHDTTGGMATKVEEAAAVARLGIRVVIAAAGSRAGAAACLSGPGGRDHHATLEECTVVRC